MLVCCMMCSETQVATLSLINQCKFSVLFFMTCSPLTASSSAQYSDHSAIASNNLLHDVTFTCRFLRGKWVAGCRWTNQGSLCAVVIDDLSDQVKVCAECLDMHFFITVKQCFSTVVWVLQNIGIGIGYQQWIIKTSASAKTNLIDWAQPRIQSNLASSLAHLTTQNR